MSNESRKLRGFGRLLCLLGSHDYEIVEVNYRFADGGCVEKLRCRRCGIIIARAAK